MDASMTAPVLQQAASLGLCTAATAASIQMVMQPQWAGTSSCLHPWAATASRCYDGTACSFPAQRMLRLRACHVVRSMRAAAACARLHGGQACSMRMTGAHHTGSPTTA